MGLEARLAIAGGVVVRGVGLRGRERTLGLSSPSRRLRPGFWLLLLVVLASGGPWHSRAAAVPVSPGPEVRIQGFRFEPALLEIRRGTTVRWVNRDDEVHTVAFLDGKAASPALDTDDAFSRRFDEPGTYPYRCAIHPHMAGTIVVR
jgi:plastocyanin